MKKSSLYSRLFILIFVYLIAILPLISSSIVKGLADYQTGYYEPNAPDAPTLIAPTNGAITTDNTPTLDWSSVSGTIQTQVQVDDNGNFLSTVIDYVITGSSSQYECTTLSDDVYFWRVRVMDDIDFTYSPWSLVWNFEVDVTPPDQPTLITPADSSATSDNTPYLDWNTVTDAETYQIQVDTDTGFGASCIIDTTTSNTFYIPTTLADTTYYWHVRAQDNAAWWGSYSATWSFIIDSTIPDAPTVVFPTDGSATIDNTPTLDWSDPTYAAYYDIEVNTQADFMGTMVVDTAIATVSQYTCPTLSDNTYFWHVRAANSVPLYGDWSEVWNFTIAYNDPVAPILLTPANNTITSDTTPTLTWSSVYQAVNYQIQVISDVTVIDTETISTSYICSILTEDEYTWRVRAQNILGTWGSYSDYYNFSIDTSGPVITDVILIPTSPVDDIAMVVNCTVTDNTGILEVRIFYRVNGGNWINSTMTSFVTNNYTYSLGLFNYSDFVEYYITATDNSPSQILSIEDNSGGYYSFTVTSGDLEGPIITDITYLPETPNQIEDIIINVTVTDPSGLDYVLFNYQINGGGFAPNTMTHITGSVYQFIINTVAWYETIEFYITARDSSPNNNIATENNGGLNYIINYIYEDLYEPNIVFDFAQPNPPSDQDEVIVQCRAYDASGIHEVLVIYRINNGTWQNITMEYIAEVYQAHLGPFNGGDIVDFYFYAIDGSPNRNVGVLDNDGNYWSFTIKETSVISSIDSILPIFITALSLSLIFSSRKQIKNK